MKRRDTFKLIPLSVAGFAGLTGQSFAQNRKPPFPGKGMKPGESLPSRYLATVRERLDKIKKTQSENLLEASYAIARTTMKGGTCWYAWDMGHSTTYDIIKGRNGSPDIFTVGYDAKKAKDGDLFLANIWGGPHEDLAKKDILVIGGPAPWGQDAQRSDLIVRDSAKVRMRPYSDIWIETYVSTLGAIMHMPGMPAPFGPISGIIGKVTYWMMMADVCRILAREGKSVPVDGDEPKLRKDAAFASLHAPLMDDYFDAVMRQLKMIEAEMGSIRQIARMAVDSVLDGGRVYCYSKERNGMSAEAQTRRGGLALTHGVHVADGRLTTHEGDFKPTSKDTMIMGLFRPDDPVDLKSLDEFRKAGMKIASLGPMTRDLKSPEGRTVPKETDVHVGRMCDTYGMFALPGFERRICPTSGALQNQMFWATAMAIAEEVIARTGNTPGVYFSAAIKDGTEHMHLMHEWSRERGY